MWESTTNFTFANANFDYWCKFNKTGSYFNITDLKFCYCNATFAADPDIAGVGVITSFVGMSLCTIVFASIAAYYDTIEKVARLKQLLIDCRNNLDKSHCNNLHQTTSAAGTWVAQWFRRANNHGRHRTIPTNCDPPSVDLNSIQNNAQDPHRTGPHDAEQIDASVYSSPQGQARLINIVKTILGNLCDLQSFTAMAIIGAAFAQGEKLSFYHEQFVIQYWWLALNSFWAAQHTEDWNESENKSDRKSSADGKATNRPAHHNEAPGTHGTAEAHETCDDSRLSHANNTPKICDEQRTGRPMNARLLKQLLDLFLGRERFRTWFRRLAILCCTTEFITFYGIAMWRENYTQWSPLVSGKCYISHDKSVWQSDWFWLGGAAIYNAVLMLSLVSKTKCVIAFYSKWLHKIEEKLLKTCIMAWLRCKPLKGGVVPIVALCYFIVLVFITIFFSAFVQFAALWSFGDGIYALEVACYLSLWTWGLYDLLDLKFSNTYLVEGSEISWSFGQVLAVILMGSVILNIIDAFAEDGRGNN